MNIAILDDYQDAVRKLSCFSLLDGHNVKVFTHSVKGAGQLAARLRGIDALVLIRERTAITRQLLEKCPDLKLISQTGKVSGHIDLAAAAEKGLTIVEGTGDPTAPAELTWALIMAAARRLPGYMKQLQQGNWQRSAAQAEYDQLGVVLKGRTLGIWGYGKIGRLIAGYGRAFGMRVIVWGRPASRQSAEQDGYESAADKATFFSTADILTVHLRLNDTTSSSVTPDDLANMKPDAIFVNTSRSGLVAPGALESALDAGAPGFAALDVFDEEPLTADSHWLRRPNVVATPHLGYVERDSYEKMFAPVFQNIVNFANGAPTNVLDYGKS